MNRANIIVTAIVIAIIGSYFGYLGYKKSEERENVFTQASKVKLESLASDNRNSDLFIYGKTAYSMSMLPEEIQQKIKIEKIKSHMNIQAMLKDYIVRLHVYAKDPKVTATDADPNKVPPLVSMIQDRVKDEKINEIYSKNLDKLPKGHDPIDIKTQIKVSLFSQEALNFIRIFLTEIYYEKGLEFSSFPQLKEDWLKTPVNVSLSEKNTPYRLYWIGSYGCADCEKHNVDLGLLLDKYGKQNLNITFVPYSRKAKSAYQIVNLAALCYKETEGVEGFWNFHARAMSQSSKIASINLADYESSKFFINLTLKSLGKSEDKTFLKSFEACAYDLDTKTNPIFEKLILSQNRIKEFSNFSESTFILNGRVLDLEGARLMIAMEQKMKQDGM